MDEEKIKQKLRMRGFNFDVILNNRGLIGATIEEVENQKKIEHQLFIGKVCEEIGFSKTLELLKDCSNQIK